MPPFPRLPLLGATLILAACSTSSANLDQPDAARAEPAPDAAVDATVHDAAVLDAAIPDAGEDVTALGGGDAALPFDDAECMPSLLDGWAPSLDCQAMPTGSCPACLSFPYVCGEQAGAFPVALAEAGAPIPVLSVLKTLWLCSDVAACVASKGSDGWSSGRVPERILVRGLRGRGDGGGSEGGVRGGAGGIPSVPGGVLSLGRGRGRSRARRVDAARGPTLRSG